MPPEVAEDPAAGRTCGARGAMSVMEAAGTTVDVMYGSDGTVYPAKGVRGGGPGTRAEAWKRLANGEVIEAPAHAMVTLAAGEAIISKSCGGGGYGAPLERDAHRVLHDALEGRISPERATDPYGVEIVDGEIDEAATVQRRSSGVTCVSHGPSAAAD